MSESNGAEPCPTPLLSPPLRRKKGAQLLVRDVVTHRRDGKKDTLRLNDSLSLVVIPCSSRALLAQSYQRTGIPFFFISLFRAIIFFFYHITFNFEFAN